MSDKHTFPIAQDDAGRIFIKHRLVWSAETGLLVHDLRELGCEMVKSGEFWHLWIPDVVAREGDADALKLSGLRRFIIYVNTIDGRLASEDAIDCNHCEDVGILVGDLFPGRKYAATIKGRSRKIDVRVARQHGPGLWDFGNFSDQGNERTAECSLGVTRADGGVVDIRILSADAPARSQGGPYSVQKFNQGWFYPLFNFLKDVLRTFGIKV